jgi:itaconyl-CoA hydratase
MTDVATWPAYLPVEPRRYRERFGLAFEQFRPGQRFQHRPGLTLSQQDNRNECLDTLNQQMLHFDERFAAATTWGRCLMDSTLTTKVVMGMTWKTFAQRTHLVGFDEITLPGPVFAGDTLYAVSEVLECIDDGGEPDTGRVKVRTEGLNQDGTRVATLVYDLLVARQPAAGWPGSAEVPDAHRSHTEVEPGVYRERMGLFLEDIAAGDAYEHRPGRTFSLEESARDTRRALDHSWEFAAAHRGHPGFPPAGINPLHVLAVVTGMQTKTFSRIVANLAWQHVRFPTPVHDGDTVFAESTVLDTRVSQSRPGQGVVHVRARATTASGRDVCTFERKILVYGRGHGPYDAAGY